MKNKKMQFISTSINESSKDEKDLIAPVPASKKIPQWYKDLASYGGTSTDLSDLNPINDRSADGSNVSTKLCLPFLDAMISGYMYLLEDDIGVDLSDDGSPIVSWNKNKPLIDKRPFVDLAIPSDCHPIHFGIKMNWYYQTPKGYSLLFTHPMNRPELPFYIPSAIVDSDIWGLPAFIPFFIKKNFIGTIKKETPIVQMIPIKRDSWELEIIESEDIVNQHKIREEKRRSHITAHYKKSTWQKKKY
jgi:hypothetical protein